MKCSNCGKSLWFVNDVCPFCKTTIQQQKAGPQTGVEARPDPEGLVTLTSCETLSQADAIRAQLEGAGIEVHVPDENLMQAVAWNLNTFGFVRVQVSSKDYETAKQVLASFKQDSMEAADVAEPGVRLAELPLSWPMRCFAFVMPLFICPGMLVFAVAKGGYSRQGCERKATELWHWFAAGLVFWVLAFLVFITLRDFTN